MNEEWPTDKFSFLYINCVFLRPKDWDNREYIEDLDQVKPEVYFVIFPVVSQLSRLVIICNNLSLLLSPGI
jgi:hypothetical protein